MLFDYRYAIKELAVQNEFICNILCFINCKLRNNKYQVTNNVAKVIYYTE